VLWDPMYDYDDLEGEPEPIQSPAPQPQPKPLGRNIRVLALHGGGSNSNVMKFQTQALQRTLGKEDVEWDFLDGDHVWKNQRTDEMMKALAKGMPFRGWYDVVNDDPSDRLTIEKLKDSSVKFTYEKVETGVEKVMKYIEEKGPFDVLLGFSQGCVIIHLVVGTLKQRELSVPWRVSVLFNGMRVRDARYEELFSAPIAQPTVLVFGTEDEFYEYGRQSQPGMYEDPVIIEHDEGHKFPGKPPRAKEVYQEVARNIRWRCGCPST